MSDIVEFLRARLDEDEAQAQEAEIITEAIYPGRGYDYTFKAWDDHPAGVVIVGPARVLREIEAKRQLLDLAEVGCGDDYERVRKALATVYADHPDYDQAWA